MGATANIRDHGNQPGNLNRDDRSTRSNGHRLSAPWHLVVLVTTALATLFSRFLHPNSIGFYEDDFFYYVQVARNLALHGISSFDGTHLTNGYHPLWMLVLAGLFRAFSGTWFFVSVQALSLGLLLVFFSATLRIFERLGLAPANARLAALLLSLHALLLFRYGMEVTLALPLGMLMVAAILAPGFRWSNGQTVACGLLAALTVLGRLDSILLVGLVFGPLLLDREGEWTGRVRRTALFLFGFTPFFVYLILNRLWFGTLLPSSGHAKQLKPLLPPSLIPLSSLIQPPDRMKLIFVVPALFLLAYTLVRLPRCYGTLAPRRWLILSALTLFPVVHYALLCFVSDWQVWPWYFYSLTYSTLAGLALLLTPVPGESGAAWIPTGLKVACAVYVAYACVYSVERKAAPYVPLGEQIAVFSAQHPGLYAMGDGSGAIAYLSTRPFLQLEGLTTDPAYLRLVERRTPLAKVFALYGVRYYVVLAQSASPFCGKLSEPNQAGPRSPHMPGQLCASPLATYRSGDLYAVIYDAAQIH